MQPSLSNIRHCLIYCSEVAVAGWDPLHLSPFLNGISTAPTPSAVSHFNDWRNDSVCVCECVCVRVRVCMRVFVRACVFVHVCFFLSQ